MPLVVQSTIVNIYTVYGQLCDNVNKLLVFTISKVLYYCMDLCGVSIPVVVRSLTLTDFKGIKLLLFFLFRKAIPIFLLGFQFVASFVSYYRFGPLFNISF